jgi:hypothetical protein
MPNLCLCFSSFYHFYGSLAIFMAHWLILYIKTPKKTNSKTAVTGMALADVGVLVVPAPIGEYEGSIQRVRIIYFYYLFAYKTDFFFFFFFVIFYTFCSQKS